MSEHNQPRAERQARPFRALLTLRERVALDVTLWLARRMTDRELAQSSRPPLPPPEPSPWEGVPSCPLCGSSCDVHDLGAIDGVFAARTLTRCRACVYRFFAEVGA